MTTVSLREQKYLQARARIEREAVALFTIHGIDGVTVDQIAAAADVGKGTIYNHFAAKEDIVASFLIRLDRQALSEFPGIAVSAATPAEALIEAAWSLLAAKADHQGFVRAFLSRLFIADGLTANLAEFQQTMDAALGAFFRTLQARDDCDGDADVETLILTFKTLHLGLSALWAMEGPPFTTARRMTEIEMTLFAKGLTSCPSSPI
jgi:TetR/AcrR family transcriptional regulator of autoinduction and epiphytic fitness